MDARKFRAHICVDFYDNTLSVRRVVSTFHICEEGKIQENSDGYASRPKVRKIYGGIYCFDYFTFIHSVYKRLYVSYDRKIKR